MQIKKTTEEKLKTSAVFKKSGNYIVSRQHNFSSVSVFPTVRLCYIIKKSYLMFYTSNIHKNIDIYKHIIFFNRYLNIVSTCKYAPDIQIPEPIFKYPTRYLNIRTDIRI